MMQTSAPSVLSPSFFTLITPANNAMLQLGSSTLTSSETQCFLHTLTSIQPSSSAALDRNQYRLVCNSHQVHQGVFLRNAASLMEGGMREAWSLLHDANLSPSLSLRLSLTNYLASRRLFASRPLSLNATPLDFSFTVCDCKLHIDSFQLKRQTGAERL